MRVACLLIPDLPLRAELRVRPELQGQPLAVTSGPGPRAQVVAASPELRAVGLQPPCPLTRARAALPELRVQVASPAHEQAARQTLLDIAFSCSPRAALAAPAGGVFASESAVFVDATGVGSLFHSEAGFAAALSARAAALGLPGVVTLASSRCLAQLAARALANGLAAPGAGDRDARDASGPVRVLTSDEERAFLAPLPIDLLDPDDRTAQALTRLGVRRVRDLLRLPTGAVARRLGPGVLQLMARARGEEPEPPLPEARDERIEETSELEAPVEHLEPLLFVLRGLLTRLLERLALRGLVCGPLELELDLDGGARDARRVTAAAPTHDVRILLRLVGLTLESDPPAAAIASLSVATRGIAPRRDQLDLFRPRGPDPAALDRTLAELEAWCGTGRVGAPALADDHRPGAFALQPFQPARRALRPPTAAGDTSDGAPAPPALAVRALRPPVAARIRLRGGSPAWIECAVARGSLVRVSGPWRTTGRWWSEDRYALDYYDVQVADGSLLRLVFDFVSRAWRVEAIYD